MRAERARWGISPVSTNPSVSTTTTLSRIISDIADIVDDRGRKWGKESGVTCVTSWTGRLSVVGGVCEARSGGLGRVIVRIVRHRGEGTIDTESPAAFTIPQDFARALDRGCWWSTRGRLFAKKRVT